LTEEALKQRVIDVPCVLFNGISQSTVRAEIIATESGVVAGTDSLKRQARALGLQITVYSSSGLEIRPGTVVAAVAGNPAQVVRGEDRLLGVISKVSGVATAARQAVHQAGNIRVVCGGWKKMPAKMKGELRRALRAGGVDIRILPRPFLYLDKNYIRIFGSLDKALRAADLLPGRPVAVQLRGETGPIAGEAIAAAGYGARVLMVDTGSVSDLSEVSRALRQEGLREQVQIAFAGCLRLGDLENLHKEDVDIVDIGQAILDAPLLDFRYDVVEVKNGQ